MTKKLGGSSKLKKHNQVTLPKEVVDFLGISEEDVVGFWIDKDANTVELFINK